MSKKRLKTPEIDEASRSRDHVCVIAWTTVLISFRPKFVDKDVVLLWSHHVGPTGVRK